MRTPQVRICGVSWRGTPIDRTSASRRRLLYSEAATVLPWRTIRHSADNCKISELYSLSIVKNTHAGESRRREFTSLTALIPDSLIAHFFRSYPPIMAAPAQNCFVDSDPSARKCCVDNSRSRPLVVVCACTYVCVFVCVCVRTCIWCARARARTFEMTRTTVRGQRRRAETRVSPRQELSDIRFTGRTCITTAEHTSAWFGLISIARFAFEDGLACAHAREREREALPSISENEIVAILTIFQL